MEYIAILFWITLVLLTFAGVGLGEGFGRPIVQRPAHWYVVYFAGILLGLVFILLGTYNWSMSLGKYVLVPFGVLLTVAHTIAAYTRLKAHPVCTGTSRSILVCTIGQLLTIAGVLYTLTLVPTVVNVLLTSVLISVLLLVFSIRLAYVYQGGTTLSRGFESRYLGVADSTGVAATPI